MSSFLDQINEDIAVYQNDIKGMNNILKNEWAFNYWVLDKLFYVEPEIIESQIVDYNDLGIDAYVFFEDTKDLFIIQNKYYCDSTYLSEQYVRDDFLLRPINALRNGTYKRSEELQKIYNKYKNDIDFKVNLEIYVTNNRKNVKITECLREFNSREKMAHAKVYYLDDIKEKYYGEVEHAVTNLTVNIDTIVKGTILNINTKDYKLKNVIDARYVFTPITTIFKIYREAREKEYPIFDRNIREYLGSTGVNKQIILTLKDEDDRKNFFYYNNGITLVCDDMGKIETCNSINNRNATFYINNPQIVNGCQTVTSIYEVLDSFRPEDLEKEFRDTFVMLKILQIKNKGEEEQELYTNIVRYNNSQNAINEKNFTSNNTVFKRWQTKLEEKGFCLLVKQSDKNKFSTKNKTITLLKKHNNQYFDKFKIEFNKVSDCFIPLEKLLQVIIAFTKGGYYAYTKKSNLLKCNTEVYDTALEFLKNDSVTTDTLLELYLLYLKAETHKKKSKDGRTPISYYVVDGIAMYECENRNINKLRDILASGEKIDDLIELYCRVSRAYTNEYSKKTGIDYNKMIKKEVDYEILKDQRNIQNY